RFVLYGPSDGFRLGSPFIEGPERICKCRIIRYDPKNAIGGALHEDGCGGWFLFLCLGALAYLEAEGICQRPDDEVRALLWRARQKNTVCDSGGLIDLQAERMRLAEQSCAALQKRRF